MIRSIPIVMLSLALALVPAAARAGNIAYDNAFGTPNNQFFGNNLGLDFDVNRAITVTSLGAFFGTDIHTLTFQNPAGVTVGIYNRATTLLVGPSVTISPTNFDSIVHGDAFRNVAPLTLAPGQYSVVATNDPNYNQGFYGGPNLTSTMNNFGGAITFVGGGRYDGNFAPDYPGIVDGGPVNRYDAGTFATPEPASLTLLGISIAGMAGYGWRKRKQAAA